MKQKLDAYWQFMNDNVLSCIHINMYNLIERGYAVNTPK